ncbi:unnamed protein product [Clonostachys rosea]|uniref:SLC26A/SulP transporter domain-containing protein n=1 Tax=Bionectria ochroleuca TaxID=29856 RepID=A0ABY6TYC8_BIOOC|nr:unnamed protein product [Clonostachys rosea]
MLSLLQSSETETSISSSYEPQDLSDVNLSVKNAQGNFDTNHRLADTQKGDNEVVGNADISEPELSSDEEYDYPFTSESESSSIGEEFEWPPGSGIEPLIGEGNPEVESPNNEVNLEIESPVDEEFDYPLNSEPEPAIGEDNSEPAPQNNGITHNNQYEPPPRIRKDRQEIAASIFADMAIIAIVSSMATPVGPMVLTVPTAIKAGMVAAHIITRRFLESEVFRSE